MKGIPLWRIPDSEKANLLKFLEQLELGRINKGLRITEARRCKYLDVLRAPLEFFGKPTSEITIEDIEAFEKGLGKPIEMNPTQDDFAEEDSQWLGQFLVKFNDERFF